MEYKVVATASADDLETNVRYWISHGWLPHGGVSVTGWVTRESNLAKGYEEQIANVRFAQAMVRVPNELGGIDG